jgi:EF hand
MSIGNRQWSERLSDECDDDETGAGNLAAAPTFPGTSITKRRRRLSMRIMGGLSALALLGGISLGLAALPASAQQMACDTNADGSIDSAEAATCGEQRFEKATEGQDEMTQDQFSAAYPDAQGGTDQFGQLDADASGTISRDEWNNWREQSFGEATQGTGGRMSTSEYETWERNWGSAPQ